MSRSRKESIKGFLSSGSRQYSVCSPLVFITDLSPWNIVYIFPANRRQAWPGVHKTFLQFFFVHVGAFPSYHSFNSLQISMLVFKPGDSNGQGTKTCGPESPVTAGRKQVLFARVRIKGLQLSSAGKKAVISLNACMLIASYCMKVRAAKSCLYSKKEKWLQMLPTSSCLHSECCLLQVCSQTLGYGSCKMLVWD